MGTIFERVTYYDLYGYTIPGCLLIFLCVLKELPQQLPKLEPIPEKAYIYIFLIFVFLGMVAGIIMSEISDRFFGMLYQRSYKMHLTESAMGISYRVIKRALMKAGVADDSVVIAAPKDVCRWMWFMYGSVQADKSYNRLHNYASSQLMYGNLSIAIGVGGITAVVRFPLWIGAKLLIVLGIGAVVWLLGMRSSQFRVKKEVYAIFWFIEKYLGLQTVKNDQKRKEECEEK